MEADQHSEYVPVTHAVDVVIKGGWITRCGVFADTMERLSNNPTCQRCRPRRADLPRCRVLSGIPGKCLSLEGLPLPCPEHPDGPDAGGSMGE